MDFQLNHLQPSDLSDLGLHNLDLSECAPPMWWGVNVASFQDPQDKLCDEGI